MLVVLAGFVVAPTAQAQPDAGVPPSDAGASDADAGVPPSDAGPSDGDAGTGDAGAPDASAPVQPSRVPPHLVAAPAITLPEGAEPVPPGSGVDLVLTIAADGTVTDASIGTPLREDIDALVLAAAHEMIFSPAMRDGVAVPARIRFRYTLATDEEEEEEEEPAGTGGGGEGEGSGSGAEGSEGTDTATTEGQGEGTEGTATEGTGGTEATEGTTGADETTDEELDDDEVAMYSVTGTVDPPEIGAATRITFRGAELSTVPGTFGDPVRAIQFLPGISRLPFGIPFLVIRGAGLNNTGYFIDGFPVPNLWHFGLGPTVINTAFVERQDFYPGNYPVRYGRFGQGIVSLETNIADDAPLHIELQVDALRAEGRAFIPFDDHRGVVAFAFRRSYYELFLGIASAVSGQRFPSLSYDDYQARIQYRFDDHFSASLFVFGSDDALDNSGTVGSGATSADTNTNINYQFQRAIARFDWHVAESTNVRLSLNLGRDATGFSNRTAGATPQVFLFENFVSALRLDITTQLAPWLHANFGVDAAGTSFGLNITAPTATGLGEYPRPAFDPQLVAIQTRVARGTPGLYGEAVFDFSPVEISLGVRLDLLRYGNYTDIAPDPRLVGHLHFTDDVQLVAATGLFTQPPNVVQTVGTGGNPRLGPQRSWQQSLGLEANLPLGIFARITGFFTYMWDIARFNQIVAMDEQGNPQRIFFVADQQGRSYGMEVLVRRPLGDGFYGSLSYTLARSERVNPGGNWFVFGFDQTHSLSAVASYEFDGWRFGLSFQLTSGRPTSSVCSATYDADANEYDPSFCDRGERLPLFHQLNARIDRDFNIANTVRGSVYIDVQNVYNATNAEGLIYQYDYARSAPLAGLPILGTIGVRAYYE